MGEAGVRSAPGWALTEVVRFLNIGRLASPLQTREHVHALEQRPDELKQHTPKVDDHVNDDLVVRASWIEERGS